MLATVLLAVSGAATPSTEPLPNSSGVFDQRLRLVIGEERGDGAAAARHQPLEGADDAADRLRLADLAHGEQARQAHAHRLTPPLDAAGMPDCAQQLADREEADHDQDRLDAAEQLGQRRR